MSSGSTVRCPQGATNKGRNNDRGGPAVTNGDATLTGREQCPIIGKSPTGVHPRELTGEKAIDVNTYVNTCVYNVNLTLTAGSVQTTTDSIVNTEEQLVNNKKSPVNSWENHVNIGERHVNTSDPKTPKNPESNKFLCWYTNADSLSNKLPELTTRINNADTPPPPPGNYCSHGSET